LTEATPEFNSENISFGGYISTPFFPISYPDDLTFEQVISCKIPVCLIHLIFVDFQIAEESIVEVPTYISLSGAYLNIFCWKSLVFFPK
jgi:hypothetical protein